MARPVYGRWKSVLMSPAGNPHDFTLDLEQGSDGPTATVELCKGKPGGESSNVRFRTHVEICDGFIALLSKDAASEALGVNAMVLKLEEPNVMDGRIIWNSLSLGTVECGTMKWAKVLH